MGGSGKDDKQEKLLNQKVVLDTHFFLEQNIVLCLDRLKHKALIISKNEEGKTQWTSVRS